MSASGRATEFMRAWGEGHNKPHNPDHQQWGADECDACMAEAYDPYEALVHAAGLMGWGLTYGVVRKLCQDWEDAAAPMRISVAAASVRACARDLRALLARCNLDGDPAGSDTGVADSDRGTSSGTNLRPGGEPSPSRQGRARPGHAGQSEPPTFEELLTDPLEQFDTHSELLPAILRYLAQPEPPDGAREALLRSIEEYRNAPPATAQVRPGAGGRPSGQFDP